MPGPMLAAGLPGEAMQKMTPTMHNKGSTARERPRLSFDRPLHAATARLTAGLSPSALFQAYTD